MNVLDLPSDILVQILTRSSLDAAVYCRCTVVVRAKVLEDVDAFHRFFRSVMCDHDALSAMYLCALASCDIIPCDVRMLSHFVFVAHIGCLPMFMLLQRQMRTKLTQRWYERALMHAAHEGHVNVVKFILESNVIHCNEQPTLACLAWYFAEKGRPWLDGAPSHEVLAFLSPKMPSNAKEWPWFCDSLLCLSRMPSEVRTSCPLYVGLPYRFVETGYERTSCRCKQGVAGE